MLSSLFTAVSLLLVLLSQFMPMAASAATSLKVPTSPNSQYYFVNWTWDTQSTP